MSEEEARIISNIFKSADGFCTVCSRELHDQAAACFPGFPWLEWLGEDA